MPELHELSIQTLKMNPTNPGACTELARRSFVGGDSHAAVGWLYFPLQHSHLPAVNQLGVIKYRSGATTEAIGHFKDAAKWCRPAAWNLVIAYRNQGDHAAAADAAKTYSVGSSIQSLRGTLIDEK